MGCLAYMMDTRVATERLSSISDVALVCEFPDAFPKEFLGFPPERHVEFRIDLFLGAAPIAKAPYRLEPHEM